MYSSSSREHLIIERIMCTKGRTNENDKFIDHVSGSPMFFFIAKICIDSAEDDGACSPPGVESPSKDRDGKFLISQSGSLDRTPRAFYIHYVGAPIEFSLPAPELSLMLGVLVKWS